MREIKFRAWDSEDHRMFTSDDPRDVLPLDPQKGYEGVMQYTGLKDKNGVEIYEGDIVEQRNYIGELLGKYEVQWGQFGFTLYDSKQPEVTSHYISPGQLEVVGNIYENPELMK